MVSVISFFMGLGYQPSAQNPTRRARESHFICLLPFDLFGMGDLPGVNTPADIALGVIVTQKLPHYDKVVIP